MTKYGQTLSILQIITLKYLYVWNISNLQILYYAISTLIQNQLQVLYYINHTNG